MTASSSESLTLDSHNQKDALTVPGMVLVGASVPGQDSRSSESKPCQDSCFVEDWGGGWGILVVSDGAGSAKYSQLASEYIAQRAAPWAFRELVESHRWEVDRSLPDPSTWQAAAEAAMRVIRDEIAAYAEQNSLRLSSLDATVIVILLAPHGLLVAHVGDGRAAMRDERGRWRAIMRPYRGERAGSTVFLTANIWNRPEEYIRTHVVNERYTAVVALSDGCEPASFEYSKWDEKAQRWYDPNNPYERFWEPLLAQVRGWYREDADGLKSRWTQFLDSGTDALRDERDDKTMVLAFTVEDTPQPGVVVYPEPPEPDPVPEIPPVPAPDQPPIVDPAPTQPAEPLIGLLENWQMSGRRRMRELSEKILLFPRASARTADKQHGNTGPLIDVNRLRKWVPIALSAFGLTAILISVFIVTWHNPRGIVGSVASEVGQPVDGNLIGAPEAPVLIEVYADYICAECQWFSETIETEILNELVSEGLAQYRFIPIVTRNNLNPSLAAECAADQGLFWDYHRLLFGTTREEGWLVASPDALDQLASDVGLKGEGFRECFDSRQHQSDLIGNLIYFQNQGFSTLPTILIHGEEYSGKLTTREFKAAFDSMYQRLMEAQP